MVRILQIGMTDCIGGIESFLINYHACINKDLFQFDYINIYAKLAYEDRIHTLGGFVYKVESYRLHPIKFIKNVKKIIKNNDYKIIHCHMNSACFLWPIIAAKLAGAKIIIAHSHNSSSDKGILKSSIHWLNKRFIPLFANQFWACSEIAAKWFFNDKIMNKKNGYTVISNAVDTTIFKKNSTIRNSYRKEIESNEKFIIGHIGRFNKQKNHEFIIDVFEKFHTSNKNAILLLVGDGPLMNDIKTKIKNRKIEDSVFLLGVQNNISQLLNAMDLLIFPSLYEGLPIVLIEAQMCQTSCLISSSISKEVILSNKIKQESLSKGVSTWVDCINEIIDENIECKYYKNISKYDISLSIKEFEKLYANFL